MNTSDAIVAGHLCLDMIPTLSERFGDQFATTFVPGGTLSVGPITHCTGGPVSNTGLALTILGISTYLMAKVGNDELGRIVASIVNRYGDHMADGLVVDETLHTSYTIVISPPEIDRLFLHYPGANERFCADDIDYERVARARLFHFGYPPLLKEMYRDGGRQLSRMFEHVRSTGVTTSLDMSLPNPLSEAGQADWKAILNSTLPHVDLFLPSLDELLYMVRRPLFDELFDSAGGGSIAPLVPPQLLSELGAELLAMGAAIVAIKLGERGLYLRTAAAQRIAALGAARPAHSNDWTDRELWAPCFRTAVVGTTGAGDATIAGFLAALLRGLAPEGALEAAVAVGACNVEAIDALEGLRSWDETMARVRGGWRRRELAVDSSEWTFDVEHEVWRRHADRAAGHP